MGLRTYFFLYLSLLCTWHSQGQNLVPNPSFEESTACPSAYSQLNHCVPWFSKTQGTPDYFDSCSSYFTIGVPSNWAGNQKARTGNAYVGIYVSQRYLFPNIREYISAPLLQPLQRGVFYYVSFYASLADNSSHGTYQLGAFLSDSNFAAVDNWLMKAKPQILNTASNSLINSENWVRVQGVYEAKGNESFITIGNFFSDSAAQFQNQPDSRPWNLSYYYIDDVLLTPCDSNPALCEPMGNYEIKVYPNPTSGEFTVYKTTAKPLSLKVYNDISQLVMEMELTDYKSKVSLADFSEGIYFVRFFEGSENVSNQKVLRHKE